VFFDGCKEIERYNKVADYAIESIARNSCGKNEVSTSLIRHIQRQA
jgi:hypothetical protein